MLSSHARVPAQDQHVALQQEALSQDQLTRAWRVRMRKETLAVPLAALSGRR